MKKNIVSLNREVINIKFEELFNRDLSHFNNFPITKRSYHKELPTMYLDIKKYIEEKECIDYAYSILHFKYLIMDNESRISDEEINYEFLNNYIKENIFSNEKLIKAINDDVDSSYSLELDNSLNVKNENLQITDDLNKKYLKSAILMRLLLPFISTLSMRFDKNKDLLNELIFEMFTECILFMNDGDDLILKKIFNIVSSRIIQTRYSDQEIWEFLEKQNKSILTTIREFNRYILINNFLKITNNTSMISYIDVVLKNKINNLFRFDYKVSHMTVDCYPSVENSNSNTLIENDKLLRKDKGIVFINEQSILLKIAELHQKYDLDEFFDEFKETVTVNKFTKIFLDIFYKKEFDIVYKDDYGYYLLYNMLEILRRKKLNLIASIIVAEESSVRNNNRRLIKEKLSESVKYKLLLEKYKDIYNLINKDKNFITDLILSIKQKKFVNVVTKEEIELDIEILIEEVLDFLYMN